MPAQTNNNPLFCGKILQKSWRTKVDKNGVTTRDVKINEYPDHPAWHRVSEKVAEKLKVVKYCVFAKIEFWFCGGTGGDGFVSPIRMLPYLEKLFVGAPDVTKPTEKKGAR